MLAAIKPGSIICLSNAWTANYAQCDDRCFNYATHLCLDNSLSKDAWFEESILTVIDISQPSYPGGRFLKCCHDINVTRSYVNILCINECGMQLVMTHHIASLDDHSIIQIY